MLVHLQVGQVILSLPHSLSQTGMVAGIIIEIVFASLAMWTVYLMVLLYLDHKNRKVRQPAQPCTSRIHIRISTQCLH